MEFHGSKLNYGAAYEDDFPSLPSAVLFCNLKTFTKLSEGRSFFFWFVFIYLNFTISPELFFQKLLSLSTNLSEDNFFFILEM